MKGYTKTTKIINGKEREVFVPTEAKKKKIERKKSFNSFIENKIEEMAAIYKSMSKEEKEIVQNRDYIFVPFAAKDNAKALSARWDSKLKSWYIPSNAQLHERQLLHGSFQSLEF